MLRMSGLAVSLPLFLQSPACCHESFSNFCSKKLLWRFCWTFETCRNGRKWNLQSSNLFTLRNRSLHSSLNGFNVWISHRREPTKLHLPWFPISSTQFMFLWGNPIWNAVEQDPRALLANKLYSTLQAWKISELGLSAGNFRPLSFLIGPMRSILKIIAQGEV